MIDVIDCVQNSSILMMLSVSAGGYVLVRATRRWGFRSTRVHWPRKIRRIGRRIPVTAGHVPRRHRMVAVGRGKPW